MSSPQNLAIPPNQAMVAAGIEPDGTRSGIAIDSESRIIISPTSGPPLPADAATHSAQIDGTQRAGVLGADGTSLSSNANPVPISDAGGSITVDGSVSITGTPTISGTVTANQGTGGVSAWKVDGSATTQPVSGTVAVSSVAGSVAVTNANLDAGLSTLATQATLAALDAKVTAVNTGAVVVSSSALPSGAATETTLAGVKTGTDRIPTSPSQEHVTAVSPHAARLTDGAAFYKGAAAGDNMGADLRVSSAAVGNANPVPVSDAGGSLTVDGTVAVSSVGGSVAVTSAGLSNLDVALSTRASQATVATLALESGGNLAASKTDLDTLVARTPVLGQALAAASTPVVLPASQAGGALALDATLTGGTQIAIAKGPVTVGAAVGSEKPMLVGGTDGTNAQMINVDTTGAVRLQSSGTPGTTAPTRATQIGGIDGSGKLRPVLVDQFGRTIGAEIDMVSRIHAAEMRVIQYGYAASAADAYRWSAVTATGGTVTYNTTTGEYEVAVTTTNASTAVHIHNQIAYYRTYCQYGIVLSGSLLSTATTNQRIEWGGTSGIASSATSLQTADAIGFAHTGGVLNIFYRSSIAGGPNVTTAQTSWNIDRLDGSGGALNPSGYNLTAAQLLNINLWDVRFVWLGAFGIEWRIGERLVHRVFFDTAPNTIIDPFARTPHMRLFVYARNSGTATANTFSFNCGCIHTNGGGDAIETPGASSRTTALTVPSASGTVPLFALRPASTYGGVSNIRRLLIDGIVFRVTAQDFRLEAWLGRATDFTYTGASFAALTNAPRSAAERDIAATAVTIGANATLLGGTTITNAQAFGSLDLSVFFGETKASVGVNGDGVRDNFLLTATALGGANGTASLQSITWTELG